MVPDMQWWNEFVEWLYSDDGWYILTTVVFPFLAIVVAGIVGALIGRGATKRLIVHQDRQQKAAAVAALIAAGRRAAIWSSLLPSEQEHVDTLGGEAETRLRLLPVPGASLAADWSAHQLTEMRRNSASYSFQAEQTLIEFRDGLITWQNRPRSGRKLFAQDLAAWRYDDEEVDRDLVEKQQQWAAQQVGTGPVPTTAPPASGTTPPASGTSINDLASGQGDSGQDTGNASPRLESNQRPAD